MGTVIATVFWGLVIAVFFVAYWIPTIIAFRRRHAYKLVILGLNFAGIFFGITWVIAVIWAAWPDEKSLIDPFLSNPSGKGLRGAGDTVGAFPVGVARGARDEIELTRQRDEQKRAHQPTGAERETAYKIPQ